MTLSYYSVVRFVPDPLSGESVNVGLVVFSPELPYGRAVFDDSERRARRIAPNANLAFLEEVRRELQGLLPLSVEQQTLGLAGSARWDLDTLVRLHRDSGNVLQFSEPLASSEDPDRLLDRLKGMYLPPLPGRTRSRDARAVRSRVKHDLSVAGLSRWLREDFEISGRHDNYRFDIALVRNGNGTSEQLIEAMALAKADAVSAKRDLDALGYSVYDLRQNDIADPIALIVTPDPSGELMALATSILGEFDGEVVVEDRAPQWAAAVAQRLLAGRNTAP